MAGKALAKLPIGSWVIVVAFLASGTLHLVRPDAFLFLMPPWLPFPIALIVLSGVAEVFSAVLLLMHRRIAGLFAILVLFAVWPANWWFAIDALETSPETALWAFLRLPLQLILIWWAWQTPVRASAKP